MLMSAPGQVQGPIKDAIQYLKEAAISPLNTN